MARMIPCPECSQPLRFQDGAIDPERGHPDFLYCDNEGCDNTTGYDPWDAARGMFTAVITLSNLYPKEDE